MPRTRQKPMNPFVQQILDNAGVSRLKDYTREKKVPYETWCGYASILDGKHQVLSALMRDAKAAGLTIDEFVYGLMQAAEEHGEHQEAS